MKRKEPLTRTTIQPVHYGQISDARTRDAKVREAYLRRTTVGQFLEEEASRKQASTLLERLRENPLHEQERRLGQARNMEFQGATASAAGSTSTQYSRQIPVTYIENSDSLFSRAGLRDALAGVRASTAAIWATITQMFNRRNPAERSTAQATFIKAGAAATILVFGGVWFYQHLPGLVQQVASDTDINTSIPSASPATYTVTQPLFSDPAATSTGTSNPPSLSPVARPTGNSSQSQTAQSSDPDPAVSNDSAPATEEPAPSSGGTTTGGMGGGGETTPANPLDPILNPITDVLDTVPTILP